MERVELCAEGRNNKGDSVLESSQKKRGWGRRHGGKEEE